MYAEMKDRLRGHMRELERIQEDLEQILSGQQAYRKTLQKKTQEYEDADLTCDSLGYAVDDLDSVLGSLDEIIST